MARGSRKKVTTWGYILEMPGRPARSMQAATLLALGVREDAIWSDKLARAKRHPTAGRTQLEGRNDLISAAMKGDKVIIADPTCSGVSEVDALWFFERMTEIGVTVQVNGEIHVIEPGDDATDLSASIKRRVNNYQSARSRGRV